MLEQRELRNRILSGLHAQDYRTLADRLQRVELPRNTALADADEPIGYAYFLESGLASVLASSQSGLKAEASLIGREGFIHPAIALGAGQLPHDIIVHMPATAYRIKADALREASDESPTLRRLLLLFSHANSIQIAFTALSNAAHHVDQRLARWLLMCHDRSDTDDLALTHEFVGFMLSIRRVSVTNALHVLEGNGCIELARGYVVIRNRSGLESFAGDAYGRPEAEYSRLFDRVQLFT